MKQAAFACISTRSRQIRIKKFYKRVRHDTEHSNLLAHSGVPKVESKVKVRGEVHRHSVASFSG